MRAVLPVCGAPRIATVRLSRIFQIFGIAVMRAPLTATTAIATGTTKIGNGTSALPG